MATRGLCVGHLIPAMVGAINMFTGGVSIVTALPVQGPNRTRGIPWPFLNRLRLRLQVREQSRRHEAAFRGVAADMGTTPKMLTAMIATEVGARNAPTENTVWSRPTIEELDPGTTPSSSSSWGLRWFWAAYRELCRTKSLVQAHNYYPIRHTSPNY